MGIDPKKQPPGVVDFLEYLLGTGIERRASGRTEKVEVKAGTQKSDL